MNISEYKAGRIIEEFGKTLRYNHLNTKSDHKRSRKRWNMNIKKRIADTVWVVDQQVNKHITEYQGLVPSENFLHLVPVTLVVNSKKLECSFFETKDIGFSKHFFYRAFQSVGAYDIKALTGLMKCICETLIEAREYLQEEGITTVDMVVPIRNYGVIITTCEKLDIVGFKSDCFLTVKTFIPESSLNAGKNKRLYDNAMQSKADEIVIAKGNEQTQIDELSALMKEEYNDI